MSAVPVVYEVNRAGQLALPNWQRYRTHQIRVVEPRQHSIRFDIIERFVPEDLRDVAATVKDADDDDVVIQGEIEDNVIPHRKPTHVRRQGWINLCRQRSHFRLTGVLFATVADPFQQPIGSVRIVQGDVIPDFIQIALSGTASENVRHLRRHCVGLSVVPARDV